MQIKAVPSPTLLPGKIILLATKKEKRSYFGVKTEEPFNAKRQKRNDNQWGTRKL